MEQHRFVLTIELIEPGDYATGHRNAMETGWRIWREVVDEAEIVVRDGNDAKFHGIPNGVYCEGCVNNIIPGVRWPTYSNGDDSHSWVERCDTCERCETDDEAQECILEWYDGAQAEMTVGHATPAGSTRRQPFVDID